MPTDDPEEQATTDEAARTRRAALIDRWGHHQALYLPGREQAIATMFDVIEACHPPASRCSARIGRVHP